MTIHELAVAAAGRLHDRRHGVGPACTSCTDAATSVLGFLADGEWLINEVHKGYPAQA